MNTDKVDFGKTSVSFHGIQVVEANVATLFLVFRQDGKTTVLGFPLELLNSISQGDGLKIIRFT